LQGIRSKKMKPLFRSIRHAALDKGISDEGFRKLIVRMFDERTRGECLTSSFLRYYEEARIEEDRKKLKP